MKNKTEKKDEKTKKKKYIRRFKPDSLRKKIKARLHKKLRDILNNNLKECGSKMLFDYLPQPFITNVNVIENKAYLKLTMRTLFKMVFGNKSKDKEKVKTNSKELSGFLRPSPMFLRYASFNVHISQKRCCFCLSSPA